MTLKEAAKRELELLSLRCAGAGRAATKLNGEALVRKNFKALSAAAKKAIKEAGTARRDEESVRNAVQRAFDREDGLNAWLKALPLATRYAPVSPNNTIWLKIARAGEETRRSTSLFKYLHDEVGKLKAEASAPNFEKATITFSDTIIFSIEGSDEKHIAEKSPLELIEYGRSSGRFDLILIGEGIE